MDDFDKKPINVNQSSDVSGTTIAAIVVALVLVVGAFFYFGSNWDSTAEGPQVTQNNTTLPAPAPAVEPPADAPATPPAAQPETPPVTPPGDAPATNP